MECIKTVSAQMVFLALVLVALMTGWEIFSQSDKAIAFFLPPPSLIWDRYWHELLQGELWQSTRYSLVILLIGLSLGCLLAIGGSMLLATFYNGSKHIEKLLLALSSIPPIAISPLLILWIGVGVFPKVFLITFVVSIGAVVSMYEVIYEILQNRCNWLRRMGIKTPKLLTVVVFPGILSLFLTAAKRQVPNAMLASFVGESISSNQGLSHLIIRFSGLYDMSGAFTALIQLALVSIVLISVLDSIEQQH
ncbi:ABC transporter permease subunit [bacterium]|nr:ABC transporter permease subunit [bacterium]